MKVNYEELRRIYRLEKNSAQLVEVEEDFFSSLKEFLGKEKDSYLKSLRDPLSHNARDFSNLHKLVGELFELREKKLLNKALVALRTGGKSAGKLSKEEKKTFENVLSLLNEHRNYLDGLFGEEKKPAKKEKSASKTHIRVIKEVPSFVGSDMKEYGPFPEGKEVELPEKTASLLLKRGLAERIE